jgi:cation:H+ antiporter
MIHILWFILSFIGLCKAADYFVDSAHALALHLRFPPVLIGATIVAFGTSAPELFVTGFGAYLRQPDVIYGNILGSNIANILLILGVAMAMAPLSFSRGVQQQAWVNLVVTLGYACILLMVPVNRPIAMILLGLFFVYQMYQINTTPSTINDPPSSSKGRATQLFFISLIGLIISSKILVMEVEIMANSMGVSTAFVSLFAVAFGTSLPELMTTIKFIQRGNTDIVIGNVFGSNLFNLAFVLPAAWGVRPLPFITHYATECGLIMALTAIILIGTITQKQSQRWMGWIFLSGYIIYIGFTYTMT